MNKSAYFTILLTTGIFFLLTGFQCQSSDMTSAKLYVQRLEWASAETSLMKEVEKNPANAEAWWLLGHARTQLGKYKTAVEAFDQSLKNSNEFEEKIIMTKKSVWGNALNMAVGQFNLSLKLPPDSANMFRNWAIENYKVALSVNPDSAITYQNLSIAQQASGLVDDQIETLKEGIKHKPTPGLYTSLINVYLTKAQSLESQDKKDEANISYNNALSVINDARKTDPDNAELLATMIDIYVRLGRANEAKPLIQEAIQKDPNNKIYRYNLGVLLMQTDSLEQAVSEFEAAIKIDPNYEVALQNAGVGYMRLGDKIKQSMQSVDVKKRDEKQFLGSFKKATEYFKKLSELKPNEASVFDLLASAYANANMLKEAKDALDKADSLRKK